MKRCFILGVFFITLFSFSMETSAASFDTDFGLSELYEIVPKEALDLAESIDGDFSVAELDEFLSIENFLRAIFKCVIRSISNNKENFLTFIFIAIAVFIYRSIGGSLSGAISSVADVAVLSVCGVTVFQTVSSVVRPFLENYSQISGYISAVSTVALGAMSASGSGASAVSLGSICSVLISVFNSICSYVVVPYVNISLVLSISGGITRVEHLNKISAFLKKLSFGVIATYLSLFFGLMSVQSVIAMSSDSLTKRTLRQLLSNGLPVFGGLLSEGVDTLFATATGIKNSAGLLGLTSSVLISIYPLIDLLTCFLLVSAVCFVLSFFADTPVLDFLTAVKDTLTVVIGIALSLTAMTLLLFYFILRVT